jgi:hypothetical protein
MTRFTARRPGLTPLDFAPPTMAAGSLPPSAVVVAAVQASARLAIPAATAFSRCLRTLDGLRIRAHLTDRDIA